MSAKCKSKSFKHEEQGSPLSSKSRFWGVCCESGKKYSQVVAQRFHMTMAALEPSASDEEDSYVSLMVERGGAEYLLCSLRHNAIMQVNLNLIFEKGENVTFFLRGQGTVHLSGYHENSYADGEISNTTESSMTEIKKAKKLEKQVEVEAGGSVLKSSPDKNANTSKKDSRNAYPKYYDMPSTSKGITSKQSQTSTDDDEDDESSEDEVKSSTPRGDRKTSLLSNDLVQTLTEDIDSEEDEDDDDDADYNEFDEEKGSEDDEDEEESEDDDDSDDDYSSGDEVLERALEAKKRKRESDVANSLKRLKKDKSLEASRNSTQVFQVDDADEDEQDSSEEEESESELCKTMPLPKKSFKKQGDMSNKKKSDDGQKKHLDNNFAIKNIKPVEEVEFEDIRLGYGPCAKQGKFINVFYTGRLSDGKVFDQITQGKPFGFKMGSGQVMKGWEVGLEGMKVGGKRRIKIPPHLGYGTKPQNGIPPNSTLTFIIELKSVN